MSTDHVLKNVQGLLRRSLEHLENPLNPEDRSMLREDLRRMLRTVPLEEVVATTTSEHVATDTENECLDLITMQINELFPTQPYLQSKLLRLKAGYRCQLMYPNSLMLAIVRIRDNVPYEKLPPNKKTFWETFDTYALKWAISRVTPQEVE